MTLWTPTHVQTLLPAIIVMLAIAVVLHLTLGKKDRKIRMIPFQIFACVISIVYTIILHLSTEIPSFFPFSPLPKG